MLDKWLYINLEITAQGIRATASGWGRRMYYGGQAATIEFKLARTKWAKFRKAKLILCRSTAYSAGGNVPFRDLLPSCLTGFVLGVLLLHRMKAQLRPLKRRDV
jgi:hypothetical protein